ncbi:hypothetical protein [Actinophytocola sp. NPDC049390]|uniref:hypothetical protein n=1 Tax=Actinophytocola sp. NPDC049390 TaxID=3363894 RepID=UPI0037A6638C
MLATELADEWVELAATDDLGVATMRCYRRAVRSFCQFVDTHLPAAAEASLAHAVPDLLPVILDWTRQLPTRWPAGSTEPAHQAGRLRKLVTRRAAHPDREVVAHLNGWLTGSSGLRRGATREVDEFSRADKKALVQAARADIKRLEQRLRRGRELLERGVDPETGGWLEPANLLWAIEHGVPTRELLGRLPSPADWPAALIDLLPPEVALRYRGRALLRALTGMLYPHNRDLHGFRILLMAATGHTSEEITGLAEDQVEFTPDGVLLSFTKNRARSVRRRFYTSNTVDSAVEGTDVGDAVTVTHLVTGRLDAADILRRLLAATARLRARSGLSPAPLFLRSAIWVYDLSISRFNGDWNGSDLNDWLDRMGLRLSGPADIRRLRKSGKVEKALAYRGRVSDVADDHSVEVFHGHYAHGTTLKVIAGHVITSAQQRWFDEALAGALAGPTVLTPDAEQALNTTTATTAASAAKAVGLTRRQVAQLRDGALDMGVSACRDPFDSPFGKAGDLCPVAPLRCLECRHALVLPSNLPQLLLLADHLDRLRTRLTPQHFHALWGQSHANLTAVLADRTPVEIELARKQIAAGDADLHLPLSAHVEFDR